MCHIKRDSLASLVHNNLFCSFDTTAGCVFLFWIQWFFWKFSATIIKDLYTIKVHICLKQTNQNIKIWTKILWSFAARIPRVWISFHKSNGIYSYLLLSLSGSRSKEEESNHPRQLWQLFSIFVHTLSHRPYFLLFLASDTPDQVGPIETSAPGVGVSDWPPFLRSPPSLFLTDKKVRAIIIMRYIDFERDLI